eukprot:scaffold7391_cov248-Pinguiococcus_pyrenoidosus.AAC.1
MRPRGWSYGTPSQHGVHHHFFNLARRGYPALSCPPPLGDFKSRNGMTAGDMTVRSIIGQAQLIRNSVSPSPASRSTAPLQPLPAGVDR